jgi:homoserine kinase
MSTVTVRVPASTSNLGPGFDTLGIALRLHNEIRVTPTHTRGAHITSPIPHDARPAATSLIGDAVRLFNRRIRQASFGLEIHLSGDVPIARGLGSSVTVRLGIVAALNELTGAAVDRQQLFELVSRLEGHPDNAAPATFGGFTASTIVGSQARCVRLRVHRKFKFVALIPPFEVSTETARRLVPSQFTKADAVHNLTRVAVMTAAFAIGDANALRGLFDDRLHQPYRESLIPPLRRVIRAGERAGAIGGWLSGSGSTIICLAIDQTDAIAKAMSRVIPGSETRVLAADDHGFRIIRGAGID